MNHLESENDIISGWDKGRAPLVSICCATYNHENYVADAIEGFLRQKTSFPFEILIRDDCSIDGTASIVEKYAKQYPSIIRPIYEKENTYKKGIRPSCVLYEMARGDYIALCEGDDYWTDENKLADQVDILDNNKDIVMTFQNATILYYDNKGTIVRQETFNNDLPTGCIDPASLVEEKRITPTASVVFRNIDVVKFLRDKTYFPFGDTPTFLYLSRFGKIFYSNKNSSVYRRLQSGMVESSFNNDSTSMNIRFIRYYKFIIEYFKEYHLRPIVKKHISDRYYKNYHLYKDSGMYIRSATSIGYSILYNPKRRIPHLLGLLKTRLMKYYANRNY